MTTARLAATCGGCDSSWTGLSMAHCAADCHQTFGSAANFYRHRKHGKCRPPQDIGLAWNPVRHCWTEVIPPKDRARLARL